MVNLGKVKDLSWKTSRSTRCLLMPDGSDRLVTLPGWAWREWNRLDNEYRRMIIRECWCPDLIDRFDYFLTARMHKQGRVGQKIAYYARYNRVIPGGCTYLPANDLFDPRELPRFPDPFWREMPYAWLEANGLGVLPYRFFLRKLPSEITDPDDRDAGWRPHC